MLNPRGARHGRNYGHVPDNFWSRTLTCDVELDIKASAGLLSGNNPPRPELQKGGSLRTFDLSHWVFTNSSHLSNEFAAMHTALKTLRRLATCDYSGKSLAHVQVACQRVRRYHTPRVCCCVHRCEAFVERIATLSDTQVQRRMFVIICGLDDAGCSDSRQESTPVGARR